MILIPPNKSERVSFKARETAKPPTPKAVISGVIDIPNDCKTNKNPSEKIVALIKPLKIPVDGREVLFLDHYIKQS